MTRLATRPALVVGLMLSLGGVFPAAADEASSPARGTRVRVTAPGVLGKRMVGTLVGLDASTLTLRPKEGSTRTIQVPRAAITRLEASRRPSQRGKGAGIGALVGLGAAVAIGLAAGDDCDAPPVGGGLAGALSRICFGRGEMAAAAAVLTIPVGALIGAGAAPGERWVRTTPDRLGVAVGPVGGGVGAAFTLRF